MIARFSFLILIVLCLATNAFDACAQPSNKNSAIKKRSIHKVHLSYDTTTTAIIKFDKNASWPFDSTYKAGTLTQAELELADSLLEVAVRNFNNGLEKDVAEGWSIDLHNGNYRKQLMSVIDKNGQRIIWVNCFCRTRDNSWKTTTVSVTDGGNCYFHFKINVAAKSCYDFFVNSLG